MATGTSSDSCNLRPPRSLLPGGAGVWLTALLLAVLATGTAAFMASRAEPEAPLEYGAIPAFELVDQSGAAFGSAELEGQLWVANFIFTRCPTICPMFTAKMAALQREAKARGLDVRFVSFSVDPDYDTPERLRAFGEGYGADFASWRFLTGEFDNIKRTVTDGMKIAMGRGSAKEPLNPESIMHGSHFVLVDGNLQVRGYYDSSDADATDRVLHDVVRLQSGS